MEIKTCPWDDESAESKANGGQLSPGVTVQKSALGGYGLFHDLGAEAGETILALPLDVCLCFGFRQVRGTGGMDRSR